MTNPQEPELPEYVSVELDRILSDWDSEKTTIITEHDVGVLIVAAKNFRKSRATPPKAEGMSAEELIQEVFAAHNKVLMGKIEPNEMSYIINGFLIKHNETIRDRAIDETLECILSMPELQTGFNWLKDTIRALKTNRDGGLT